MTESRIRAAAKLFCVNPTQSAARMCLRLMSEAGEGATGLPTVWVTDFAYSTGDSESYVLQTSTSKLATQSPVYNCSRLHRLPRRQWQTIQKPYKFAFMITGSLAYGYSFGQTYCLQIQMPFFVDGVPVHTAYDLKNALRRSNLKFKLYEIQQQVCNFFIQLTSPHSTVQEFRTTRISREGKSTRIN